MSLPEHVSIVEVGPRDGLQNEQQVVTVQSKVRLIEDVVAAGITRVEAGSFVNPKWVPQMADSEAVYADLNRQPGVDYAALTPNLQGFERAVAAGANEVSIFAAVTDEFSLKNINCTIAESLRRFEPVMSAAAKHGIRVRGYASCVLGCPISGEVAPQKVVPVVRELLDMGCYEVSLGDTIGTGTAGTMQALLDELLKHHEPKHLAVHCHDTYGQALSNILVALHCGIASVDASVAGLGGCPYAVGATGNVATEDVVYMLQGMNIDTGIDLPRLISAGQTISNTLGRPTASRVAKALGAKHSASVH